MAKRKTTKNTKPPVDQGAQVQDAMVKNGLQEALFMPFGAGPNNGVQLSQSTTMFINLRNYLISNFRNMLSYAYAEFGVVQVIVDVPVDDALRGGIDIKSKQVSPEDLKKVIAHMEREDDLGMIGQTRKWTRLFGGGGLIILTDQDPSEPLDVKAINENTPLEFRDADMWELFFSMQNLSDTDAKLDNVKTENQIFFDYYGVKVHHSRVITMKGVKAPSFIRPQLRGWGMSVLEPVVRAVNQFLKATDLAFEVLDEYKVDVFKIDGLASTLISPGGEAKVRKRVALANKEKNFNHALTMDAKDDFDHKQLSFAGISETMKEIRMQLASELRMPLTKVFGISAQGFNSGEDDIENYNGMIEGQIRSRMKYDILKVVELRCQQLLGVVPDDLEVEFKPLRVMSSEQEENVKTQKFNRLFQSLQQGVITAEEFRDACNQDSLLTIQVNAKKLAGLGLDDTSDDTGEEEADVATEGKEKSKLKAKEPKETKEAKEVKA